MRATEAAATQQPAELVPRDVRRRGDLALPPRGGCGIVVVSLPTIEAEARKRGLHASI
ncbi:MAG: hypothetical protein IPH13_21735 [Planctomycetes bacterium]|nr:hypothetical protein [Planctomycetota bacterium]